MEAVGVCSSRAITSPIITRSVSVVVAQKPATKVAGTRKGAEVIFPLNEPGPRKIIANGPPIKLLTNVEKLRLLSKAEKAGLLSAAEKFGFSLSIVERLGLLSKAEELGLLSAATDPGTPGTLLTLSLVLLLLGPACVYIVPEDYPWEVALQVLVALVSVVGGSAAFAASSFVSYLQRSK